MTRPVVYVGDVHCVVGEIEECARLLAAVRAFAGRLGAARVVFLGDQFHTMSTIRSEVLHFWHEQFRAFVNDGNDVIALVGNHDLSNDRSCHVMENFPEVTVVDRPVVHDGILHLPYMHDPGQVVAECQQAGQVPVVVCHAMFSGSVYENGEPVLADAVDPAVLPQRLVISGHNHKPQRVGKVLNVGSPRWRTSSDANEDRAVVALWHGDGGTIERVELMDTSPYCRRIITLSDTPEVPAALPAGDPALLDVRVTVTGSTAYVLARAAELEARGCRVATVRTDAVQVRVAESEGVPRAWRRFTDGYVGPRGTPGLRIREIAGEHYGMEAT